MAQDDLSPFQKLLAQLGGYDVSTPELPPVHNPIPKAVPDIPVSRIRDLAAQISPLTADESAGIQQKFGANLDPSSLRKGVDQTAAGTNLEGWHDTKVPTIIFRSPTASNPGRTLNHEATHVWQQLGNVPGESEPIYDYSKSEDLPFKDLTHEQQAEMVADQRPKAQEYIKQHPTQLFPRPDIAFLDSVKQRYRDRNANAIGALSSDGYGNFQRKDPFAK
jgi:hypothetical protein